MSEPYNQYDNPLIARYASARMSELWSPQRKFSTWRRLWVALAEAEAELGLSVTPEQIAELRQHVDTIDFAAAERHERRLRHDVMAHVHAYGDVCPTARPIIHLGATSCYVTDNTDLLLLREAMELVRDRLVAVIDGPGPLRPGASGTAVPGLHAFPARSTNDGGQAGLPVGLRFRLGPGRDRVPSGEAQSPRLQGHHRHAGQFSRPFRGRSRKSPAAGRIDLPQDRFRG